MGSGGAAGGGRIPGASYRGAARGRARGPGRPRQVTRVAGAGYIGAQASLVRVLISLLRPVHRPFADASLRTATAALCVAVACTASPTQFDQIVYGARPSVIDTTLFGRRIATVTVADSARVGAPLTVRVPTQGGGCVRQGETRVEPVSDLVVEVQPFDSVPVRMPANVACTLDFRLLTHTAEVRFGRAGTATLRVRGRGPDFQGAREIVLERVVVVR